MILIACIDDKSGLAFNKRRQSKDKTVTEDIIKTVGKNSIIMDEKSASLFENADINIISPDDVSMAKYYFIEFTSPSYVSKAFEGIILYKWNRRYPADIYFDIDLKNYILKESFDFPGNSHEKITKEIYIINE